MKRFVLTPPEERVIDWAIGEYLVARRGRDRAIRSLSKPDVLSSVYREQLEVARETIRLMTELDALIRTQR